MQQNITPMSPNFDPSLANQSMPPSAQSQMPSPQQGMQQPSMGQPGQQAQPMSEAEMILKALTDRLAHHSKITQKTVNTLTNMIDANQQVDQTQS